MSKGFKILDTSEVCMAFSAYTMFLNNNPLSSYSANSIPHQSSNNSGFFAKHFGSSGQKCPALLQNEHRSTDRANVSMNYICSVTLVGPTQMVPTGPTSKAPSSSSSPSDEELKQQEHPPKYDPEIVFYARTHRLQREKSALAEVSSLQSSSSTSTSSTTQTSSASSSSTSSSSYPPSCARVRDCATLVLRPPAAAMTCLNNNIITLFAFVDPASDSPEAHSKHLNSIPDSDRIVPLQSIRFNTRVTAFTTFTTHVDYRASIGICEQDIDNGHHHHHHSSSSHDHDRHHHHRHHNSNNYSSSSQQQGIPRGPFSPAPELWSVFGFGSGDIIVWSHSQEAMLKRHNNTTAMTKKNASSSSSSSSDRNKNNNNDNSDNNNNNGDGEENLNSSTNNSSSSGSKMHFSCVEPGIAVSAISRVERGSTEMPICVKWRKSHEALSSSSSSSYSQKNNNNNDLPSPTSLTSPASPAFNTQVTCFCDIVVGYENGMILVVSLNATGGFVNQKLSGWFGFSAIRCIQPCPVAPYLLAVGSDTGSVRFLHFPWSFDVPYFESRFESVKGLGIADIGRANDPRVLASVPGAVSGGAVTSVSWSCNGDAVVCTGEDDAVSIVSIETNPPIFVDDAGISENIENDLTAGVSVGAFSASGAPGTTTMNNNPNNNIPKNSSSNSVLAELQHRQEKHHFPFLLQQPLLVHPLTIHRRHFHRSWITGNMVLSLDVLNIPPGSSDLIETRKVTAVYTASIDGVVVAGAAFPASELSIRQSSRGGSGNGLQRHDSIGSSIVPFDSVRGLGIRQRPLARFTMMARNDTILGFGMIGEYHPTCCSCVADSSASLMKRKQENLSREERLKQMTQRKRSFVTITAKGTIAVWTFYDILVEQNASE